MFPSTWNCCEKTWKEHLAAVISVCGRTMIDFQETWFGAQLVFKFSSFLTSSSLLGLAGSDASCRSTATLEGTGSRTPWVQSGGIFEECSSCSNSIAGSDSFGMTTNKAAVGWSKPSWSDQRNDRKRALRHSSYQGLGASKASALWERVGLSKALDCTVQSANWSAWSWLSWTAESASVNWTRACSLAIWRSRGCTDTEIPGGKCPPKGCKKFCQR